MTQFKPPFSIYHNQVEIGDAEGHICTAESPEIAKTILAALNLAHASAQEELWACTGCGSMKSIEQIRGEHPEAIACCPERKMAPRNAHSS